MNEAWTRHTVPEEDNFAIYDKYSQMEFNEHWHRLLLDFGSRNLTYSSDVLRALSGVAQIFAADLEDEYMAGIWKRDFRKGLLWSVRYYQTTSGRVEINVKKAVSSLPLDQQPTATSGPSWSWTSRFLNQD